MATTADRGAGYLETAFRERLGLERKSRADAAKSQGLLNRQMKERERGDWKQQRQVQYATVKHVARIGARQKSKPHVMGLAASRGSAKTRGQATRGVRSGAKKTEGQQRKEAREGAASVFSAGGVAQLSGTKQWTASGGREAADTRSVFHKAQKVIDPLNPYKILQKKKSKGLGAASYTTFSAGGSGQQTTKGGRTTGRATGPAGKGSIRGQRIAKKAQQRQASLKARFENYKLRILPTHGPDAAEKVMYEYNRRQNAMFGEGGTGGTLTPELLWGDMERPT